MKRDRAGQMTPLKRDPSGGYHYDQFDQLLRLALDPTMTYSCAYFLTGKETLDQAQIAKIDLAFQKVGLKLGHRLLDVGCGWGAAALRANERYGARAVGLTLSKSQLEYAQRQGEGRVGLEYRLQGWETYHETCDRIVSIGAFEHFGVTKYDAFFTRCREILPSDGLILLQTITMGKPSRSFALLRYGYFLYKEIYHGGELPRPEQVVSHSREAGFELLHLESLRSHYPRTIDAWVSNLEKNKDLAIRETSLDIYEKFIYYLTTAAKYYRSGETNVYQFLFRVI